MSTPEFTTAPCTKAEAIYHLAKSAFYTGPEEDRCLTHSILGAFGADWDLVPAMNLIEAADEVMWDAYGHGHDLVVKITDEDDKRQRTYFFQVTMPAKEVTSGL